MDVGRESRSSTPPQNHPWRQKQPTASPSESGVTSRRVSGELTRSHADTPAATAGRKPRTIACDRCRKIRKKCDGTRPICSRCSTKGLQCVYTPVRLVYSTSTTTGHPEEEELGVSAVPPAADHLGHTHPHTQNNLTHPQFMKPPAHQTTVSDPASAQLSCLPFPQHGAPCFPFIQHQRQATTYPIHTQNPAGHIAKTAPNVLQRRVSDVSGSSGPSKETPMKSTSKAPIHLPSTRPVSCEGCRQQKRKCDKLRPRCSLCSTRKVPCTYTVTAKRSLEESLGAINKTSLVQTTKKKPMYIASAPDATTTHTPGTHTENPDERNLMTNSNVYTRARIDSIGGGSASGGAGSDGWCPSVSQGSSDRLDHLPNSAVACAELSSACSLKSTWLQVMLE
ncbi:hypothetical protein BJ741DRAFT_613454 [Chytriomyces cf. hyalinus JEL632]|nr:hypothetical protein BJ741DRAFT_613454 [Chytriomyces cf. hyalinus JEL632]